jgi:hypothetical protein
MEGWSHLDPFGAASGQTVPLLPLLGSILGALRVPPLPAWLRDARRSARVTSTCEEIQGTLRNNGRSASNCRVQTMAEDSRYNGGGYWGDRCSAPGSRGGDRRSIEQAPWILDLTTVAFGSDACGDKRRTGR